MYTYACVCMHVQMKIGAYVCAYLSMYSHDLTGAVVILVGQHLCIFLYLYMCIYFCIYLCMYISAVTPLMSVLCVNKACMCVYMYVYVYV